MAQLLNFVLGKELQGCILISSGRRVCLFKSDHCLKVTILCLSEVALLCNILLVF